MTAMRQSTAVKLASAVALAGSTQAYGQIIQLTLPNPIAEPPANGSEPQEFYDLTTGMTLPTNDGGLDIRFEYYHGMGYFGGGDYVFTAAKAYPGIALAENANGSAGYAPAIAAGTKIGSDTFNFKPGTYESILTQAYSGTVSTYQQPNTPEYLAFQFTGSDGKLHDGYFELETQISTGPDSPGGLIFLQAEYNSQPDTGDGTGDIVVPEPGTLSSLLMGAAALGAVGLARRRRAIAD